MSEETDEYICPSGKIVLISKSKSIMESIDDEAGRSLGADGSWH